MTVSEAKSPYHLDDIAVWPDQSWAFLGDVRRGEYNHMSDDYERVRIEDHVRLKALGIFDELNP